MTQHAPERSPLARFVLFMVCLAILGSSIATAHYYAVDLPEQQNPLAPDNGASSLVACEVCKVNCKVSGDYYTCMSQCELVCSL